jgi:GNAT superfamily N-acetyltransferase
MPEAEKLKTLMRMEDYEFCHVEDPQDIEHLSVDGFEFFKGLGIIDYRKTFMAWLRKFPKPLFFVVIQKDRIISWVHVDEWRHGVAKDGNAINILRAIETLPSYRSRKIGYRLVFLALQHTVGYMITKPVSPAAKRFFRDIGFKEEKEFRSCPIDMSAHPGYLVLTLSDKRDFVREFSRKYLGNNSNSNNLKINNATPKGNGLNNNKV